MIQEEIKVRVLKPSEGHMLTQAADVAIEDRVISDKVFLAVNDVPENWKEITDAEADAIRAGQEEAARKAAEVDSPRVADDN
ncbi:MAG: hypothetical protein IJY31_00200 [Muribaculaceae bacterium]|nr:hypothetical protein [Muribaculaceae bacterium]